MNTKTTLFLAFTLVVMVLMLYFVKGRNAQSATEALPAPQSPTASVTRDLFEEKLGDIVDVRVERRAGEPWVFHKNKDSSTPGMYTWRTTKPVEMPCVRWEVDKFGNQLGMLKYEISYQPGQPGAVSAERAGLEPPLAKVTLTDADDRSETVEIGNPAGPRQTYVRLSGGQEIFVAKADLSKLVKDRLLDYRNKQIWDFKDTDAKKIEIEDRSDTTAPVSYVLARDSGRWMMQQPVTTRVTGKVDEMISLLARLRAVAWYDDRPGAWATYGLDPAAYTIRVTVESEVPAAKDKDEDGGDTDSDADSDDSDASPDDDSSDTEAQAPRIETKVYELHLSQQSPIGDDDKVFMRINDETAIATLTKTSADKLKPVMNEWRDMRITAVDATSATRIEFSTPAGQATLAKDGEDWTIKKDGGRAETEPVKALLQAIKNLRAVVFLDKVDEAPQAYGFDHPKADFHLTIPGVEGVERITVGAYTDTQTKRLIYVRRNDATSVAKVRASDVANLLRPPVTYRSRVVVDVAPQRIRSVKLAYDPASSSARESITLSRNGTQWSMVEPVQAKVDVQKVETLAATLGALRATNVVAEAQQASAFGLHAPAVTVTLTTRDEKDDAEEGITTLLFARNDGKAYAKRDDRKTIYAVDPKLLDQLTGEFRETRVLDFEAKVVQSFTIRTSDATHTFERRDDRWIYRDEPDLPLDKAKVENLLLQLHDLRTTRFVKHQSPTPDAFGLAGPDMEVTITMQNGVTRKLRISKQLVHLGKIAGHYAGVDGLQGVFVLTDADLNRFKVNLDALESKS